MTSKTPYQTYLNLTLRTLVWRSPTRSLSFAFANKHLVTDSSDTTSDTEDATSEREDATNHLHVNQPVNQSINQSVNHSEQGQRQATEDSLQAHLKVVNREKYSKIPKFPNTRTGNVSFHRKAFDTGSTFTSSVRSETLKLKGTTVPWKCYAAGKDPLYNTTRFDKATIVVEEEKLFDPTLLNLTTNSLDYHLHRALSQPPRNNGRFEITRNDGDDLGRLTVVFSGTSLSSSTKHRRPFRWCLGSTGPGGQFFEADPDEVQSLLDRLCYILQRLEPMVMPNKYTRSRFLHSILNRLIRYANPAFKLKALIRPRYYILERYGSLRIMFRLHGFTFTSTGAEFYSVLRHICLAEISSKPPKTSIEDRYTIAGTDCPENMEDLAFRPILARGPNLLQRPERMLALQSRLRDWNSVDRKEQYKMALRLMEKMTCTFDGYVGPSSHLHQLTSKMRSASLQMKSASLQSPISGIGRVRAIWVFAETPTGTTLQAK